MGTRINSWWQRISKLLVAIGIIVAFVIGIALIVVVVLGYWFNWSWVGVSGGNSTIMTITTSTEQPPAKTLWDWMQLLFIPVVLAIAGFWFNHRERKAAELRAENERKAADKQADVEREIALDNQREAALQAYINEMSELLLHANLRKSKPEDEECNIARVRKLTVLLRLDGKRKSSILQFLYESGLIDKTKTIIVLKDADLSEADLNGAEMYNADLSQTNLSVANLEFARLSKAKLTGTNLQGANLFFAWLTEADMRYNNLITANLSRATLKGVDLTEANLSHANFKAADLNGAILDGANLSKANITTEQLNQAKSLKGATMPDGSIHP